MQRVFLITGASKGIGLALAHRLARAGHEVVGLVRRVTPAFPGTLVPIDLADTSATDTVLAELTARFRFAGVVNNVGLVRPQRLGAVELPALEETELFRANNHPPGSEGERRYLSRVPMGRLGDPDEIAAAIAFLLSDDAGFITGQTIHVDGGASIGQAAF